MMIEVSRGATEGGFGTVFMRAVFAGWLIALMVWLFPAAESARVSIIIIITYLNRIGRLQSRRRRIDQASLTGNHWKRNMGQLRISVLLSDITRKHRRRGISRSVPRSRPSSCGHGLTNINRPEHHPDANHDAPAPKARRYAALRTSAGGDNRTLPDVSRFSIKRCASAACASSRTRSMRNFSQPSRIP